MKSHFKSHIKNLVRYQTSVGRDLGEGLRLDRNEKISNFSPEIVHDIFSMFKAHSLSASPAVEILYKKLSDFLRIPKEMIYITSGITECIRVLYETLTNPGENVVVLHPTYPFYFIYAKMYQIEYRKFSFNKDMAPDWNSFYRNLNDKTTMVMIPNPNLPIESMFHEDEIRRIADKCKEHNTVLVIDEAYHYFGAPSVTNLINEYDNLVVTRTFSKAFGLAGLRLGFMVSTPENIEYVSKTRPLVESNTLSIGIAEYMLDHPEHMQRHVREVREGSEYLRRQFSSLGLKWFGGHYTNGILVFLDSESEVNDVIDYLKKKKIYIRGAFEPPYDICIRVSIGSAEIMKKFMKAFKEWLAKKRKNN